MIKIIYIYLSLMAALAFASCQKDNLEITDPNEVPEGYVKIEVEPHPDFQTVELSTRSGDNALIATAREMAIKNAYLCVFEDNGDAATDKLIQFKPVIRDVVGLTTMYYAVLEEVLSPVILHGVSNIDQSTIDAISATEVGGVYAMTLQDFYNNVNMTYPGTMDQILRNADNGLLPKYVDKIELTELTREKIDDVKAVTRFSYARVDVVMPEPYAEYPRVLGASVSNAPTLPYSPFRTQAFVESHEVTPSSNQHSYSGEFWPDGVTTDNQAIKYIQGMYIYSTAVGTDVIDDIAKATYLIIRARKDASSPANGTYYKIALRLKDEITGEYDYSIKASKRYLVRVHTLDSNGYTSLDEAIAGPPSNINYDITIDGTSTSIASNGQYYIGVEQADYRSLVNYSRESNMMYDDPTMITEGNIKNITTHEDGTIEFDFVFSYNAGDASITNSSLTTKTLELPAGISVLPATTGYHDSQTWGDNFGTKKLRLKSTSNNIDGDVIIKVGELTLKSRIEISGGIVTDYTDATFVNELTGLADGYGGVSGLRVANSYMAAPHHTYDAVIFIPVAERINQFWNSIDGYAGAANAMDDYANLFTTDWTTLDDYSVEVSWYDGANIDGFVVEKAYSPAGKNAIKAVMPRDFTPQNIVVNVKHSSTIIWSWHLWITDYNPYLLSLKENATSAAIYPTRTNANQSNTVNGGEVHAYSDKLNYSPAIWEDNGIYAEKFIMDRNLGAEDFSFEDNLDYGKGILYYQFGRKDPLPGNAAKLSNASPWLPTSDYNRYSFANLVKNPRALISTGGNWTDENIPPTYGWFDRDVAVDGSSAKKKSIFDPSPLGWRVPVIEVWNNFDNNTFKHILNLGREYVNGDVVAIYPASGGRSSGADGGLVGNRTNGYYRTMSAKNGNYNVSITFVFYNDELNNPFENNISSPISVRPVQE